EWIMLLHEVLAYVLASGDIEDGKNALNYLYTAAFLETCKNRMKELGLTGPAQIEAAQSRLGVDDAQAPAFYTERVDRAATQLAENFYARRKKILSRLQTLRG
ncbi:MAG: hypothetical protein V1913_00690, partial [Fibrobacterota bacterium]